MATILYAHMDEGGTYIVNISTVDEDGNAVAPETLKWTLTDDTGAAVINGRSEVEIAAPSASEDVVLDGDDCAIQIGEESDVVTRIFTVTGTYDSVLGVGLHLRGCCYILLDNYETLPIQV